MRAWPRAWWTRITLLLIIVLLIAALAGATYLRNMLLTGGLNKSDRPEIDGIGAVATTAMVVGTTGGQAQEIGAQILRDGGNAIDAALATAMGQITLAAGSWVSFAGINNIVYYEAATGNVYNMNAAFNTVAAESDYEGVPGLGITDLTNMGQATEGHYNGRTTPVPGFMRGVEAAHKRFGKLPWADVFEPVIALAAEGFEVDEGLATIFSFRSNILSHFPETRAQFVNSSGEFYKQGEVFKQPALAATLRSVVDHGADYMYTGPWAQKAVAAIQSTGGRMTLEDMANYRVQWEQPLHTVHNGYDVYAHGLPSYGGINLIEALNLVEVAGLRNQPHYSESPESFYWLAQIMRPADASRALTIGDADLNKAGLLVRAEMPHAERLWADMQQRGEYQPLAPDTAPRHSDGVVVIDGEGNMAALLHTINAIAYGEGGLVVDGISLPDALTNQLDVARVTPGGARLPDPAVPVVVLKDGKPFAAFSSIGAGLHPRLVSVMHSVLDFDMKPGEALKQPAYGLSINFPGWLGKLWGSYQTVTAGELSPEFEREVEQLGLEIVFNRSYAGYVVGAIIDPETGERHGGTIEQMGGRPVGY